VKPLGEFIDMAQGSPEWHEWRATCYTASQAAAVMGDGAFWPRTPYQLYRLRTGQQEVVVTQAMRDGSADEDKARRLLRTEDWELPLPMCAEGEWNGMRLGASLDGVLFDDRVAFEIKRPARGSASPLWSAREAPPEYLWQLTHQLLVAPVDEVRLVVYAHDLDEVRVVDTLRRDSERFAELSGRLLGQWVVFHQCLTDFSPPSLGERDEVLVGDDDQEWLTAAAQYRALSEEVKVATERLAAAKDALVALAEARGGGAKVRGGGLQAIRAEREGSVNWKAKAIQSALAAAGVDPDKYRGKPTVYWTFKEG
jgi:putative phage-type endonuclease